MTDTDTNTDLDIDAEYESVPPASAGGESEVVLEVTDLGVDFWVDGVFYPAAIGMGYVVRRGPIGLFVTVPRRSL